MGLPLSLPSPEESRFAEGGLPMAGRGAPTTQVVPVASTRDWPCLGRRRPLVSSGRGEEGPCRVIGESWGRGPTAHDTLYKALLFQDLISWGHPHFTHKPTEPWKFKSQQSPPREPPFWESGPLKPGPSLPSAALAPDQPGSAGAWPFRDSVLQMES